MMKNKRQNPFGNLQLTAEEQGIEDALTKGEYREGDVEAARQLLEGDIELRPEYTETKPVTFRAKQLDILKLKAKAQEKQMPYQRLLNMLIHEYVEGRCRIQL